MIAIFERISLAFLKAHELWIRIVLGHCRRRALKSILSGRVHREAVEVVELVSRSSDVQEAKTAVVRAEHWLHVKRTILEHMRMHTETRLKLDEGDTYAEVPLNILFSYVEMAIADKKKQMGGLI